MSDVQSAVNLARAQLQFLDRKAPETKVSTPMYVLLLETLINLGSPSTTAMAISEAHGKFVTAQVSEIRTAEAERAKADQKEREAVNGR